MNSDYILQIKNVTKRFPGVAALRDVSIALKGGEVLAICGENGAGKSTLMKILSGSYRSGEYEGEDVYKRQPTNPPRRWTLRFRPRYWT